MYDEKFCAFLEILEVNSSFAASIARVKVTVMVTDLVEIEAVIADDS